MEDQNNGWKSVPQFGGWDQKNSGTPDYSMVFQRARQNRKQVKVDVKRASIGNERELMTYPESEESVRINDKMNFRQWQNDLIRKGLHSTVSKEESDFTRSIGHIASLPVISGAMLIMKALRNNKLYVLKGSIIIGGVAVATVEYHTHVAYVSGTHEPMI